MSLFSKLKDYFYPEKGIAPLPRHLVQKFDVMDLGWDEIYVLQKARARDAVEVRRLIAKHGAKDGFDLIEKLPIRRRRVPFVERLFTLLRRIEGSSKYPGVMMPRKPRAGYGMHTVAYRPQFKYKERKHEQPKA